MSVSVVNVLVYFQVSKTVLKELPDLCLVASKWHWFVHSIFLGFFSHNLSLCKWRVCHDQSNRIWDNFKCNQGLIVT
jgi:hypothetical protein